MNSNICVGSGAFGPRTIETTVFGALTTHGLKVTAFPGSGTQGAVCGVGVAVGVAGGGFGFTVGVGVEAFGDGAEVIAAVGSAGKVRSGTATSPAAIENAANCQHLKVVCIARAR